ncbi:peptidase, M28 family [Dictyocaulus viviparus]|uniref:FXNA-like protease n=1 Tax=Dictyocaulus viviparus TaxID=29172 RepID=A0A0D8XLZ9_DICVI|nr:peptidase, M28 family [Dictyocaulus viviparus]
MCDIGGSPEKCSLPVMEDSSSDEEGVVLRPIHWLIIVVYIASLTLGTIYLHKQLPDPLPPSQGNNHFSELRARRLLFQLSNIGPKPVGSEACEHTKNHLLFELSTIKTSASVKFEIVVQNPSGCFDMPRLASDDFTICYRNISNIAVRLSSPVETIYQKRRAVLLNCHYDSWPTSSGGSDNLISCALMVELIRLLSRQPDVFVKSEAIFLFNGAEESGLQGAHGFITQHQWRHNVRAFINLDSSGSGGKELLFQAGPSSQWLLKSYFASAIYPHCSVIGQEIFQSGFFPGDTDFRVFKNYGRLPEFDEARRITPGSLQRAGDNIYATVIHLLESQHSINETVHDDQNYVFFDVAGLFVVVYPEFIGNSVNTILILTVLLKISNNIVNNAECYKDALINYIIVVASMCSMVLITSCLTLFIWGAMSWYSIHGLAVLIYGVPAMWTGTNTMMFLAAKNDKQGKEDLAVAIETVHQFVIALILTIFTLKGVASGFLFALMLLPIVKDVIPIKNAWGTVLVHLVLNLPCFEMCIYLSEMLLSAFIPIMGRNVSNPEGFIAFFTTIPVFVIVLSLHVNRALYKKDGGLLVRDSGMYVIAQDYRGVEDIPFVDGSGCEFSVPNIGVLVTFNFM